MNEAARAVVAAVDRAMVSLLRDDDVLGDHGTGGQDADTVRVDAGSLAHHDGSEGGA